MTLITKKVPIEVAEQIKLTKAQLQSAIQMAKPAGHDWAEYAEWSPLARNPAGCTLADIIKNTKECRQRAAATNPKYNMIVAEAIGVDCPSVEWANNEWVIVYSSDIQHVEWRVFPDGRIELTVSRNCTAAATYDLNTGWRMEPPTNKKELDYKLSSWMTPTLRKQQLSPDNS
jgi:hypothetical protein